MIDMSDYFASILQSKTCKKMTTKTKGKEKIKFKTILADPYKKKYPVLNADELNELRDILVLLMNGMDRKGFAGKCVRLGLESCIRTINNKECACVLISLSLNPKYIIGLLGRSAEIADATTPVFVQPKLEEFTKDLFGIAAMIMVFPLQLISDNSRLDMWIKKHKKPKKAISQDSTLQPAALNLKKKRTQIKQQHNPVQTAMEITKEHETTVAAQNTFGDDYISFSDSNISKVNKLNLEEDKHELLTALQKMASVLPKTSKTPAECMMDVVEDENAKNKTDSEEDEDQDDFLENYQPLTVYKIRPNADKKPKRKRKKNKVKK